jgi:hypothetical protein
MSKVVMENSVSSIIHRRRSNRSWPLLCAIVAALGGCASFDGAPPRPDGASSLEATDKLYHDAIQRYHGTTDEPQRKRIRDEFIEIRAGIIDRHYSAFKLQIYSQRVGANVGVDIATLGLNAIGASVSGAGTKTTLHALSGGLIGSKASVDKNVYFDRTLPALLTQMDGLRAQARLRLLDRMLLDTDRYPMVQAAADLEDYYSAGTITGAITGITEQAGAGAREANQVLDQRLTERQITQKLEDSGFDVRRAEATPSGDALRACLSPGGVPHAGNRKALAAWIDKQGVRLGPMGLAEFVSLPTHEGNRKAALADAALMAVLVSCPPPTR